METLGDINTSNYIYTYSCDICDFKCCKTGDYKRHISTDKHKKLTLANGLGDAKAIKHQYICQNCNKEYNSRNGLWKHKKTCIMADNTETEGDNTIISNTNNSNEIQELKEFMKYLMKENTDMKSMMMEVIKNGTTCHSNNTTHILKYITAILVGLGIEQQAASGSRSL